MQKCLAAADLFLLKLRLWMGLALACGLGMLSQAAEQQVATVAPNADVLSVEFDHQPAERGLIFDRSNVQAGSVELEGKNYDAWLAEKSIDPTRGWQRSFRFKVTDPQFQKGGRQVVDIEITYNLGLYGELDVKADTAEGPKVLGRTWTQPNSVGKWQVYRLKLDKAYFGARSDAKDVVPKLDGFDLRLDSNQPLKLRSVRIIGYDPDKNVNWGRMLSVAPMAASTAGGVFLFPKGPKQELHTNLQNYAHVDRRLYYKAEIAGYDDNVRFQKEGTLRLPANGSAALGLVFDTRDWPLGPYDGKLDVYLDQAGTQRLSSRNFRLGVITSTNLEKARSGEFLYGLDAANTDIYPTHTPGAFAFYRLMGVDLLRCPYDKGMSRTTANLGKALAELGNENLQSVINCEMPRDYDPKKRQTQLREAVANLEEQAKLFGGTGPGKAHFFELGNEPDLPAFNPFPMAEYASHYYAMYNAIKRGSAAAGGKPGDTQVMNGGLSFAGGTGDARSREFLKLLDLNNIDIIAYHGHGPGIAAERSAYERVHEAAASCGKASKPFAETESGVSASNRPGMVDQARTAVEKMTYAQSVGEPFFLFFRLFMEGSGIEGGYGLSDNLVEPRPSVLSYRNMVERLRHFRYVKSLDFAKEIGAKGVTAFLFAEMDAQQRPTGRQTVVAFGENPVNYELRIQMDSRGGKVDSPELYDMYGNQSPVKPISNTATISVGLDPVYLCWRSQGGSDAVAVSPAVLSLNVAEPMLVGASTSIPVVLRNPGEQPLKAEFAATAQARVGAKAEPATQKLELPPNELVKASVAIRLERGDQPLGLPHWWKVFPDVDHAKLSRDQLSAIPDELPGTNGKPVAGQFTWAKDNHIDIGKIAGGLHEKRPAILYALLDSPKEMSLKCGASADWWMAWYLNGQRVYDTLEKGNLERSLAVHSFTLPLKKGRNVLSVAVLSGCFGWALDFGGPKELQISQTSSESPDSLTLTLKAGEQALATQKVPFEIQPSIPLMGHMSDPEQPKEWMALEPLAVLEDQAVTNFWMKEPDNSKWYKGKNDLSGIIWLRDDGKDLHLFASINDDKLVQATKPDALSKNDSMRIMITDEAGKALLDTTGGLIKNAPVMTGAVSSLVFNASRRETPERATTCYHFTIPKILVGSRPFRLNLEVTDNDADFLKQSLRLGDVQNPNAGVRVIAEP